jgi:hypothetical protein
MINMQNLPLKFTCFWMALLMAFGATAIGQTAQTAASSLVAPGVPRLVKVSGVLKDASGKLLASTVGIDFSVYAESTGGVPLWQETQNVVFLQGRYTVFLGSSTGLGISAELFASGQPRWLGVRILLPGEEEQPRTLLASVPYALKAVDADTLGGLPASAYLKAESVAAAANNSGVGLSTGISGTLNGAEATQSKPLAVTTSGGTTGIVPVFSGSNPSRDIENSPIADSDGDILIPRLNSVRYVGGGITAWAGSDIGAKINAAYADLPATGGTIVVLPNPLGGPYRFSTPITLGTPAKTALLTGTGPAGTASPSMNQGTILEYTPTSGCAVTLDYLSSHGSGWTRANGIRDIALWNNHTFKNGGTKSGATGVCEGVSNGGAGNAGFSNVYIAGFGTGISLTNQAQAWGQTIEQSSIVSNTIGIATDGFIENVNLTNDVIAVNGTGIWATGDAQNGYSNPEFNITGGSIDSNCIAINYTQPQGGGTLTTNGVHFENLNVGLGTTSCPGASGLPFIIGNPNLFIFGGVMMDDGASGDNATGFVSIGTDAIIVGTQLDSVGRTENEGVIQLTGPGVSRAFIVPYNESPKTLTKIVGGNQAGFATVFPVTPTSEVRTVTATIAGNLAVNLDGSNAGGNLAVAGNLSVAGAKNFKIDDPLDPANKYLYHTSVESPDMMNLYNGVIKLNSRGEAWVQLPSYFQALNQSFRYQLTSLGRPQSQLYIAHEVSRNRFKIAGGVPWARVSWQVTGIRHDAYAEAHRSPVEIDKPAEERGHYLHPELFGESQTQVVQNSR